LAPTQVRLFNHAELPERFFFDTSFLVDLVIASQPRHAAAEEFFGRLVAEQRGRAFFISPLTYAEFSQATARIFLIADHGVDPKQVSQRMQRGGLRLVIGQVVAALSNLNEALDTMYESVRQIQLDVDLWFEAAGIMSAFGVLPYDSLHVAATRRARTVNIITFDHYFDRVPDLMLWRDRL
jgi:predicted nucleic acid-binding protein